jgi:carboxylesterase 2
VPYITGNNAGEYGVSNTFATTTDDYISYVEEITGDLNATFLAVYPADNDTQASTSQIALVRDQSTVSSWQAMDGFSNSSGATTYTYYWSYAPPNDGSASHGSEIPYALGNLWAQAGVNYTSEDFYVANVLSSYWANFIKTSDPNSGDSYNNGTLPAIWKPNSVVGKTTFKVGAAYENIGVAGSDAKIQAFLEWFAVTPAI